MRGLLIILSRTEHESWAQDLARALNISDTVILVSTPAQAAATIASHQFSPSHVVLDIGASGSDILAQIDVLAHQCEAGTRVVAVGDTNDIHLYREIIARGVVDYMPMPAVIANVVRALTAQVAAPAAAVARSGTKRIIVFISAASGDGASTVALNTAYAISRRRHGSTVLVDMDYQFGMVAKQLGLQNQYGIGDLFDHPERGVDATLIKRMVAGYGQLDVITAPSELRYMPTVSAETMRTLIATLSENYDNVILDLPHVWLPWVSAAIQQSTHLVLVAQLWLKSVSHAARIMRALRDLNMPPERVMAVINRCGAKFKEAIDVRDFERVCNINIRHKLVNDIKTIVAAEAQAKTVMELPPGTLSGNLEALALALSSPSPEDVPPPPRRMGLFSKR